jgi:TonB family protein
MDRSRSPPLDAFYPSAARRDGITGATVVQVCTDASGKLRGEPTIGESSGSSALDAAALRWASFASFVPATRDGSPVAACFSFRVRFDLTD